MSRSLAIPAEIAAKLEESLRRVRRILCVRGLCVVLFVALMALLLHMAILAMLGEELSTTVGWLLWAVSIGAVGLAAFMALIRPVMRKFTPAEIAALIERNHPELEERLSTVVELSELGEVEASSSLLAEITRDAVRDVGSVSPRQEFTHRTVKPRLLAAAIGFAVMGGLFLLFPSETGLLFVKAVNPSAEIENIYAASMEISPASDQVVMAGTDFKVTLRQHGGGSSKAYVLTRAGEDETSERMALEAREGNAATFGYTYAGVARDFSYRVKCGRAVSGLIAVKVVPEPSFSERRIEIEHPAYTRRERDVNLQNGTIVGLAGSTVTVSVRPSRPDLKGELYFAPELPAVPAEEATDGTFRFTFTLTPELAGSWGIALRDAYGFSNACETAAIALVKDLPPEVKLTMPTETKLALSRNGEIPLGWEVSEDFALSRTVLEMCVGAGAWAEVREFDSVRAGGVLWRGDRLEPLIDKDFGNAAIVRFRLKAEDNLPVEQGGPGIGYSPEITVELTSTNASLARQTLSGEINQAKNDLEDIVKRLTDARNCVWRAGESYKVDRSGWHEEEGRRQLDWSKGNVVNAERLFAEFIEGLEAGSLQTGVELFRPLLERRFVPSRQKVEDVYLVARRSDKAQACGEANRLLQQTLEEFLAARRRFEALSKRVMEQQKLEEYAERERALAELAEEGAIDAKTLAEHQERLERQFREEFKDAMEKCLGWQQDQAKRLAERAEKLAERQEQLKERLQQSESMSEDERKELAKDERRLAEHTKKLAQDTNELKRNIENVTGPYEDDPEHTAEPVADAQRDQNRATEAAREAADEIAAGEDEAAERKMEAVAEALSEAKEQLEAAKAKMGEKNQALAADAQDFKALAELLQEAAEAAKAAAAESVEQQAGEQSQPGDQPQPGEQQQGGEQQKGEQQPGGEQQPAGDKPQAGAEPPGAEQQAAQKAAQAMQQKAQQLAQQLSPPGPPQGPTPPGQRSEQPGEPSDEPGEGEHGADPVGEQGALMATDEGEDWFKLKGDVPTGAEGNKLEDVPEEYRGLVRDYFDALRKGGK